MSAQVPQTSGHRQLEAIQRFAKHTGFEIVDTFRDPAVSGADPIEGPGFAALIDRIEGNGGRTVIVEDASRFARDLVTHKLGILSLEDRNVRVLTSSGDDLTNTDDHFEVAMRQIAGAFARLEKARLGSELKHARDRKHQEAGWCEGRKIRMERAQKAKDGSTVAKLEEALGMAKRLRRANPVTGRRRSLRKIEEEFAARGTSTSVGAHTML